MIDKQVNESPLKIFAGVTKLFVLLTGARPEVECHGELTGVSPYSVTTHQPVTTISLPSKTSPQHSSSTKSFVKQYTLSKNPKLKTKY